MIQRKTTKIARILYLIKVLLNKLDRKTAITRHFINVQCTDENAGVLAGFPAMAAPFHALRHDTRHEGDLNRSDPLYIFQPPYGLPR
ncbi:MAG: hypothetical protein Q6373_013390 [Candidatus Sigynarchaeota archaeon]